ncbi:MAG: S8 family serine peptidase [Prochloraceae cyanobacterium]|nr:S8 family serine peptidase [Prochloraceae cyanobacterium]
MLTNSANKAIDTAKNPTAPLFPLQWYLKAINALSVWPDYTEKGVSVTVFDTGVDPNHPDLINNYDRLNHWDAATNKTLSAIQPLPGGHGTSVAGLIALALFEN